MTRPKERERERLDSLATISSAPSLRKARCQAGAVDLRYATATERRAQIDPREDLPDGVATVTAAAQSLLVEIESQSLVKRSASGAFALSWNVAVQSRGRGAERRGKEVWTSGSPLAELDESWASGADAPEQSRVKQLAGDLASATQSGKRQPRHSRLWMLAFGQSDRPTEGELRAVGGRHGNGGNGGGGEYKRELRGTEEVCRDREKLAKRAAHGLDKGG